MRAEHVLVLGAIVVGCGGETTASQGAISPPATAVAPTPQPPVPPRVAAEAPKPPLPSPAELAKKTLQSIVEAQNARDAAKVASAYAEDAVLVAPGPVPSVAPQRVTLTGREAIQKSYAETYAGVSNMKFGFSRVWQKDDVVVSEWVTTFKHSGDLMGMKATDRLAGIMGVSVSWMTPEGLVKREHRYFDTATIAGQVGLSKQKVRPVVVSVPASWETIAPREGDGRNVDLLKAVYAGFEKKSEADFLGALSDNPVHEDYSEAEAARGKDAARKGLADFTKAFPEIKLRVDNAWAVGDFAIAEVTMEGVQKGPLGPLPPSNKAVKVSSVDIAKIDKNGKVHQVWTFGDQTDVLVQIGVLKPPAAPKPDKKPDAAKK